MKKIKKRINRTEKALRKLFRECRSEPDTPDGVCFPPINRKPCLWWRGTKVIEDKDAKGFIGFGVNTNIIK